MNIANGQTINTSSVADIRQRYALGVQFRIDAPGYPKKVFTIHKVREDYVVADCGDGITTPLDYDVIEYYQNLKKIRIVGKDSTVIDHNKLIQAKTQLIGQIVWSDEQTGAKILNAIEKAHTEFLNNKTIEFDGQRLRFCSRETGKERNVTSFGCTRECPCGNGISYHRFLFSLLKLYYGKSKVAVVNQPRIENWEVAA